MTKEQLLSNYLRPSQQLIADLTKVKGDILILGAGGKMGPSMARLAIDAIRESKNDKRVIAVSRFSDELIANELTTYGVKIVKCDLLNDQELNNLPEVPNIIYLAGYKFGTTGNEPYTWIMNTYLPGKIAEKFKKSNIVVFSSGNIYPLTDVVRGGSTENSSTSPAGEYAQSCLGRERMFQYFCHKNQTPMLLYRLNYANDVSYGILLEIAKSVYEEKEINLAMGNVNVIWQGDANEIALRALLHCEVPAKILNVTGPETASVRWIANEYGRMFNKIVRFTSIEKPSALLNNAAEAFKTFGYPSVTLKQMLELIGRWILEGGKILNKPTHFQEREGKF